MIMVSDLVIGSCECNTALPTNSRSVVESLFAVCQRCHVEVVCKNGAYFLAFAHNMFIKFVHYDRATVHDEVGLVLGVFTDSVADSLLIN